tara:strand:- start:4 stop:183 length:180 start_codon:yes stop_codon:yes gene_type:complete
MKTLVQLNWKIADLIREEKPFEKWYTQVFKTFPPESLMKKIRKDKRELDKLKREANLID